jgi:hypothetical protein
MFAENPHARLIGATMLALAVLAFGIPLVAFRDVPQDVPARTLLMLKVEARHMTKVPLMFQQVTVARTIGTPPNTDAEGIVVWRTLFGIRAGEIHIERRRVVRYGEVGNVLFVPLAFIAAEVALAWLLLRRYF